MNGPQDMGGMMGFGPVVPEFHEPVFHAGWERRTFAFTVAMGATRSWNIDMSRRARESQPALTYWSSSYYEIWLAGLTPLMLERGLVQEDEIKSGKMSAPQLPVKRVLAGGMVPGFLARGEPVDRPLSQPSRFKPGDKVRIRNMNPESHTRLPRYARGRAGEIARVHGTHVFPDSSSAGKGDDPQWLYSVRFSAKELWGKDTPDYVHIDLWEPYIEGMP